jgi:hypothetical protein
LPEYDQWYRDHLYDEFSDSLTVFISKWWQSKLIVIK